MEKDPFMKIMQDLLEGPQELTKEEIRAEFIKHRIYFQNMQKKCDEVVLKHTFSAPDKKNVLQTVPLQEIDNKYDRIKKKDLELEKTHIGKMICGELVEQPFTITAVQTLLQDLDGELIITCFYNCGTEKNFKKGTKIGILDPYYKIGANGKQKMIRVDSRARVIYIRDLEMLKTNNSEELKNQGNSHFKNENYLLALDFYSQAIELAPENGVLYSNRSLTKFKLGRYYQAEDDAKLAICKGGRTPKFLFRQLSALSALRKHEQAIKLAEETLEGTKPAKTKELKSLAKEMKEIIEQEKTFIAQQHGEYDLKSLIVDNTHNTKLNIEEYNSNIKIGNIYGKGRGILATSNINKGELICVSKAFAMKIGKRKDEIDQMKKMYINLESKKINLEGQEEVLHNIIHKVEQHPPLALQLYKLFDGSELDLPDIEFFIHSDPEIFLLPEQQIVIDEKRITNIASKNTFKVEYFVNMSLNYGKEEKEGSGLWLLPSFFNHSCMPNAQYMFIGNFMFIRALQNISINEEINVTYIPMDITLNERSKLLSEQYSFICECDRCLEEAKIPQILVQRIQDLSIKVTEQISFKSVEEEALAFLSFYKQATEIEESLKEMLDVDISKGIPGELLKCLIIIGERIIMHKLGNLDLGMKILEKALLYLINLNNFQLWCSVCRSTGIFYKMKNEEFDSQDSLTWEFLKGQLGDNKDLIKWIIQKLTK